MLTRAFAAIGLAVASVLLGAVPAIAAGPPVDCGSDAQWDGRQCKITATNPGRSGKTPLSVSLASVMGPPCCHEHGTTWKCYRA